MDIIIEFKFNFELIFSFVFEILFFEKRDILASLVYSLYNLVNCPQNQLKLYEYQIYIWNPELII